tara:strand:- start:140 stop:745 length:606 start_codon:yes stop_codon:yes gene_type:complete
MKTFLKSFSYIFHPLFMPMLGVLLYFSITPKFVPEPFLYAKVLALSILTIVVPLLFYFLLRNLKMASSIFLSDVNERRIPLLCNLVLTLTILKIIINGYEFPELYYFFIGILLSTALSFILVLFKFKVSLHMVGICGVIMFIIGLSMHYSSNLLLFIALLIFAAGASASSRLQAQAHTYSELITGVFVGLAPQFAIFYLWL